MTRTIRDMMVYGRGMPEVMGEVMVWAKTNNIKVEENRGTYLKVRLPKGTAEYAASFIWETLKMIEITVNQDPRGVVVHAEGYIKPRWGKRRSFRRMP